MSHEPSAIRRWTQLVDHLPFSGYNLPVVKVGLVSLGCPKNQVDSEHILGLLESENFGVVEPSEADVVIVNTCAFITAAVEEAVECILLNCRKDQGRKLIVTGCLPQRYGEKLIEAIPEIDYAVGANKCGLVVDAVRRVLKGEKGISVPPPRAEFPDTGRHLLSPAHYAYVKIAEGCSNWCAYCTVPSIRGPYQSRSADAILKEARDLSRSGVKELILIAQDTALWGIEVHEKPSLEHLLRQLSTVNGIEWIRLLYLHPAHVSAELIDGIAVLEKVCKYADIPIQHISDRVLAKMGRGMSGKELRLLVSRLRERIPGVVLRTTVMVGFPGEREEDFEQLFRFVEETEFDALGLFKFSAEEGTEAFRIGHPVEEELIDERFQALEELQRGISLKKNLTRVGETLRILVDERVDGGRVRGRTEFQTPDVDGVVYVTDSCLSAGDFADVTVTETGDYDLYACTSQ